MKHLQQYAYIAINYPKKMTTTKFPNIRCPFMASLWVQRIEIRIQFEFPLKAVRALRRRHRCPKYHILLTVLLVLWWICDRDGTSPHHSQNGMNGPNPHNRFDYHYSIFISIRISVQIRNTHNSYGRTTTRFPNFCAHSGHSERSSRRSQFVAHKRVMSSLKHGQQTNRIINFDRVGRFMVFNFDFLFFRCFFGYCYGVTARAPGIICHNHTHNVRMCLRDVRVRVAVGNAMSRC